MGWVIGVVVLLVIVGFVLGRLWDGNLARRIGQEVRKRDDR